MRGTFIGGNYKLPSKVGEVGRRGGFVYLKGGVPNYLSLSPLKGYFT
jgi:hypothetical protein